MHTEYIHNAGPMVQKRLVGHLPGHMTAPGPQMWFSRCNNSTELWANLQGTIYPSCHLFSSSDCARIEPKAIMIHYWLEENTDTNFACSDSGIQYLLTILVSRTTDSRLPLFLFRYARRRASRNLHCIICEHPERESTVQLLWSGRFLRIRIRTMYVLDLMFARVFEVIVLIVLGRKSKYVAVF